MEELSYCFDCLQLQIKSDFSDELIFNYGISTSAFPFGSSAILQTSGTGGGGEGISGGQFILQYMPSHHKKCFTKYVNEYILDSSEGTGSNDPDIGGSQCNNVVNGGIISSDSETRKSDSRKSNCNHSGRFSCFRTIASLAPIARVGISSYSSFQEVAADFLSGLIEDHVLDSLDHWIEGKASGRDSINFLSLLGLPSFEEDAFPGSLRHPNIAPVLAIFKTSDHVNMVLPETPYNLESILHFNPNALKSDWHKRFLIYQLLSALSYLHGLGVSHGDICPSNIMLTDSLWSWLRLWSEPVLESNLTLQKSESVNSNHAKISCCNSGCHSNGLYADLKLSPSIDWHSSFHQWWRGELSNFEYLLILNRLAGRRWGDHTFHPVMPWVIDFSAKPDDRFDAGWRDLSKSKWRLAKGDEQLDFTYSTSEIPHHVSDECLSELAVCSYKARRLPLSVLRMAVRSVYEPNEYPSTMQRLYQWTPDECIPEFYCDAQIFRSIHDGMADLAVPSWAESPEDFIKMHRDALESNRVSFKLHHWIDIIFGYKMSGQAAIAAKNVMLPPSEPMIPRSSGRRQLFTRPHPIRHATTIITRHGTNKYAKVWSYADEMQRETSLLSEAAYLQELEQASAFSEHARHLDAHYHYPLNQTERNISSLEDPTTESFSKSINKPSLIDRNYRVPYKMNLVSFLQHMKEEDEGTSVYPDLLLWRQKLLSSRIGSEDVARDIFSVGCLLAELHLCRPLFDSTSLAIYLEDGTLPGFLQELTPHVRLLVEACIEKDWMRRPSAKILLESPYFHKTVKSSYTFLSPLQLVAKDETRLRYAANVAKQGALREMGTFATEMCATYCLPLVVNTVNDTEAEWAYILLKEFMKCLTAQAVKTLILPTIQKILQTTGYLHLKVSLLQDSFVREIWNRVGKQAYLETIHPLVLSNLYMSPDKSSAASASVLLIGSSEELGVPITVHQTIFPLVHCFGKGLCADGIDVLVRIGGIFGESFIVKQMLPLLKNVARSFIDVSSMNKPDPVQSWSALALIDCMMALDGLVAFLTEEVIVKELLEDQSCIHIGVLMQKHMEIVVLQVAATALFGICQRIGADLTALHILPKLKELFDELAFSQEISKGLTNVSRNLKIAKLKFGGDLQIESRMDLVLVLYPSFASLLGIEKLRQCCATWLLLEQFLLRCHNWKWEYAGESSKSGSENNIARRPMIAQGFTSEYNPAKLLLNGVGWSIPQSQGSRSAKNLIPQRRAFKSSQSPVVMQEGTYQLNHEPWFWFPSPATIWDGPEFLGRVGIQKDDLPWKIRASVIYSVRAHHGAVRSLAVNQDECTVFTAGIGQGYKGTVQKWELSRTNCLSGYYGHEEVVNDICILSSSGRVASCDGTIHIWNNQTGKQISVFAESQTESAHPTGHLSSASKINSDQANVLNLNTLSNGILSSAFDSSLYTCMHLLDSTETLVVGTGNGSLRFIDVARGQKLHIWRGESNEPSFPSLISAICSSGSDKMQTGGISTLPSLIATGLSSGHCKLFDAKSGNVISSWRAHDGYVTKLAAPEDHLLISSSLDRTLRVWDLRMNLPSQPFIFRGHSDGISSFSIWGQDVISISRNRIGLVSLSKSANETDGQHHIIPQKLYVSDNGTRSLSALSSISILPFSRLFLIGTEDGYLRICC